MFSGGAVGNCVTEDLRIPDDGSAMDSGRNSFFFD